MVAFRIHTIITMLVMAISLVSFTSARPIRLTSVRHRVRAGSNIGHRQQLPIRIHRRDDHGDVASHDAYESQLHKLEAALQHYEEYGDAESLKTYLKGFTGSGEVRKGDGGEAAKSSPQGDKKEDKKPDQNQSGNDAAKNSPQETSKGDKKSDKDQSEEKQQQPQQQQQQQPSEDDCEDDDHFDDSQPAQPQPQPQPQPKSRPQSQPKMVKKPKPQPESYTSPSPNTSNNSDASNSINGYTVPAFSTTSSPSTTSLYTASPFSGRATFYDTGLGACGITNSDNDPIVAVSRDLFEQYNPSDGNPNHNSLCGRKVEISWNGKKAYAFATDECPGCEKTSLDCSPGVFDQLDDRDKGVLDGISWRFV